MRLALGGRAEGPDLFFLFQMTGGAVVKNLL